MFGKFLHFKTLVIAITVLLFVIPFFWLKPGEMDLGGDANRVYFYDPLSYIFNVVINPVSGNGVGKIEYGGYSPLPHIFILFLLKHFLSSTSLIILFNSLKLSIGFLAMYKVLKEIIPKKANNLLEISAILGGLFYIFSRYMIGNYDVALLYHNQVFLNPLMFYLFLKFLLTHNMRYMWIILLLSFIFAPSFGFLASPVLFAFYPLCTAFLLLYVLFIRKQKIPWKGIIIGFFIFLLLQAFHLVPLLVDVFYPGSHVHFRLFNQQDLKDEVGIFFGILAIAKLSVNMFLPSFTKALTLFAFVTPFIIVLGILLNKKKEKTMLLTSVFFLVIFFFVSGRISWGGAELYSKLFYIPGFAMFRNFTGVFSYIYSFFYALLFGQALMIIFTGLHFRKAIIASLVLGVITVLGAWKLIDGEFVNQVLTRSHAKIGFVMDSRYEEALSYISAFPKEGKILSLPFTDCCFEVVHGTNSGAYEGPSMVGLLSGKNVFSGYNHTPPYSDTFLELTKAKDYESIKKLLGIFNIQYIFYNSDPLVYDTTFPDYPYGYVRQFMPSDQKGYDEFVKKLTTQKVFESGPYGLYRVEETYFLPHFYTAQEVITYDDDSKLNVYGKAKTFFPQKTAREVRAIYVERQTCKNPDLDRFCIGDYLVSGTIPKISFERINKTKYKIKVTGVKDPYILVFSNLYHEHWKLIDPTRESEGNWSAIERFLGGVGSKVIGIFSKEYPRSNAITASYFGGDIKEGVHTNIFFQPSTFEMWGKKAIAERNQFEVNGYANAWYITTQDMQGKEEYELTVELVGQRVFYLALPISIVAFLGLLIWGIKLFSQRGKAR